jgi:hypothetical protein
MSDRIWTDEQVSMLNERQKRSDMHPYTCPGDHRECDAHRSLIATPCGWKCACGRYTQKWSNETGGAAR